MLDIFKPHVLENRPNEDQYLAEGSQVTIHTVRKLTEKLKQGLPYPERDTPTTPAIHFQHQPENANWELI